MPRTFCIPERYSSDLLGYLKQRRGELDPRKKDKSPTVLPLGELTLKFARHFGFCFGVENAIEIAYRAVSENPGKRIFLLSEMIHNPHVNDDLRSRGVEFLFTTYGEECIPLEEVTANDVVIIPAFGTTREMFQKLEEKGVDIVRYNTTCPFVEKVWKRGAQLGAKGFAIIIHGKARHEETRATFSHISKNAPSLIIADTEEAHWLSRFIRGQETLSAFHEKFSGRFSESFVPERDLLRLGVVNQTTMLASETRDISRILRDALLERFGESSIQEHFSDTRDTLCYATSENQEATQALIQSGGDVSLVVGGYNSSNTSHLVELCEEHFPSYFVKGPEDLLSVDTIRHLSLDRWELSESSPWFPEPSSYRPVEVVITSGASCPDALVQAVVQRLLELRKIPFQRFVEGVERSLQQLERVHDSGVPSVPSPFLTQIGGE
ncbi:4-hydroxy-3-methylbut-2-enyl diphosphate reductase [bacterium]|nr:4-hydroxy-3-methylbut-2-enyl diphosphate reductase [bacterium]